MLFTLEVLQAKHGDCLLLHFGEKNDPKTIVIDAGPAGIYRNVLKPRLENIRNNVSPGKPLPLSMVMVSHLDDDHVNGICMMTDEIVDNQENGKNQLLAPKHFWFNTFDDIIGNIQIPVISAVGASSASNMASIPPQLANVDHSISAVIASTSQGRRLRDNATVMSFVVNSPFKSNGAKMANLVRGDAKKTEIDWDGLKITVICPDEERIQSLQAKWDKDLKTALDKGDPDIIFASIASMDTSPFNLSSIVCLVELDGHTILLTGDGRSDDILEGLEKNNLLEAGGNLHVDILKMPHHGSFHNMHPEFLQRITADHYVISADGKHDNPDQETLDMIAENVTSGTIYMTNHDGEKNLKEKLDDFVVRLGENNNDRQVVFREENSNSIVINLKESLNF